MERVKLIMCIGDDPVARAMPYLIGGMIFLALAVLAYFLDSTEELNAKSGKVQKIILIVLSIISFSMALLQYTINYKCIALN